MFDPLLDPILDGDPGEEELTERLAVYDAYMGLFDVELDRVLFRHGMLPGEEERTRIKWVVARFMQEQSTSDLDAIEPVVLTRFLPREHELRLLDQELDWVVERYEPGLTPAERAAVREWVTEFLDANVTMGLTDLERVYVASIIPNRLLDRHLEDLALWFSDHHEDLQTPSGWELFARWAEAGVAAVVESHTEETGVRAVRLQAMHVPGAHVESLIAWACRPGSVLHGAAGLRLLLAVRESTSREDVVSAFRVLDRFWKILLVRRGGEEREYWGEILKESSRD